MNMHDSTNWRPTRSGGSTAAYIVAMIGAAVYYVQQAATFGAVIIGLLKALVWPAFLVYHALVFLRG